MPYVTLGQASAQFNISKSVLSQALKAGKLSIVEKTANGSYHLDPAEVSRFKNTLRTRTKNDIKPTENTQENALEQAVRERFEAELSGLKAVVESERRRADAAETDRDAWRDQARTLAITDQSRRSQEGRGGLFGGWFGRKAANG